MHDPNYETDYQSIEPSAVDRDLASSSAVTNGELEREDIRNVVQRSEVRKVPPQYEAEGFSFVKRNVKRRAKGIPPIALNALIGLLLICFLFFVFTSSDQDEISEVPKYLHGKWYPIIEQSNYDKKLAWTIKIDARNMSIWRAEDNSTDRSPILDKFTRSGMIHLHDESDGGIAFQRDEKTGLLMMAYFWYEPIDMEGNVGIFYNAKTFLTRHKQSE